MHRPSRTRAIFQRQHSGRRHLPPPPGPSAHARPGAHAAIVLLRLRDHDPSLSRAPFPPRAGREGRELRKGGKGGWRGRGERLLTPWLRKGEAAAASAEEGRSGERRRGERGDGPGARRGRGYTAMAGLRGRRPCRGGVRRQRVLRMGNEAAPGTGARYTGAGAARPARILPRPASARPPAGGRPAVSDPGSGARPPLWLCGPSPCFSCRGRPAVPDTFGPAFLPSLTQARFPGSDSEGSAPSPSPRPALVRFSLLSPLLH